MTREEADVPSNEMILERARQASKDLRKRFREDLEQEPCDDAISRQAVWDVMQELWGTSGELLDRLMALPPVTPQPVTPQPKTGHWIPVSERLPEINDDVLISLEWGIDIGRYSDGEWCSEWINNYDDGNVLAWMPLPAPYEPQESEKE